MSGFCHIREHKNAIIGDFLNRITKHTAKCFHMKLNVANQQRQTKQLTYPGIDVYTETAFSYETNKSKLSYSKTD